MKHGHVTSCSTTHRPCPRGQGAFTLIEMVVSLSIISIVFLAMGSVMILTAKAIPDPDGPTSLAVDAADIARQMMAEIQTATSVITATDKGITFTVPDRDGDGSDETILYLCSDLAGRPLARQVNGGTVVDVLPNVYEFELTYTMGPPPEETPPTIEGEEELYLQQDGDYAGYEGTYTVNGSINVGQFVIPDLPADAVAWRITRIYARLKSDTYKNGVLKIRIKEAESGSGEPGSTVDSVSFSESNLSTTINWYQISFSDAGGLDPDEGAFVVFSEGNGSIGTPGYVGVGYGSTYTPSANLWYDSYGWSERTSEDMRIWVYGAATIPDPDWTPKTGTLETVTLTLNTGQTPASRVRTSVTALNQPVVP